MKLTRFSLGAVVMLAMTALALFAAPEAALAATHAVHHLPSLIPHGHGLTGLITAMAAAPALERKEDSGANLQTAIKSAVEPVMEAVEELKAKHAAELTQIKQRNELLETAMRRGGLPGPVSPVEQTPEQKAFWGFIRRGENAPDVERKALVLADDTAGGYLAPSELSREIVKNLVLFSPVRAAARVGQMNSTDIKIPKRTGAPTAAWVSEIDARPSTAQSYGQLTIPAHEMSAYIDVSVQLLEDSAFALDQEIAMDFADEFGRLEGAAFVSGDGLGKPVGILTDTSLTSVNSGSATKVADVNGQANGLIDALYALAPFYRNRAAWMMNGTTLASVRKLKDGNNNYIWQPGIAAGQPETVLGRPVIEAPDMPNEGAGTTPIVVGDFQSGYRIYDRVAMSILRDPYTLSTTGQVRFLARRRVGADVVKAEAFKKVVCAA